MKKLGLVLFIILISSIAYAQIIQFSGAPTSGGGGGSNPPVVVASIFNIRAPSVNTAPVGPITASNNPTNYSITSCAGCDNYFQFPVSNQPNITVTPTGVTNITGTDAPQTFSPVIQASNASGPSSPTTITINAYLDPSVNDISFATHVPAVAVNFGTVIADNGGIVSWAKGACTPACDTFFAINNNGVFSLPTAGAIAITAGTYTQTVIATNVVGNTGTGTVTIVASPSAPSNVATNTFNIPTPALVNDPVGHVTISPAGTATISSCVGCVGFFTIDGVVGSSTYGNVKLTQNGANAYNGLVNELTFSPVVSSDDGAGTLGAATQTVNGWADGSKGAPACTAQHPTLFTDVAYVITPPWKAAGIDYCIGWASAPANTVAPGGTGQQAISAAPASAGVGYNIGQVLTAPCAVGSCTTAATFTVRSIGAGGVLTGVNLGNGGSYTVLPANPVSVSSSTQPGQGGGVGATLNITWSGTLGVGPTGCARSDANFTVTCNVAGATISGWNFANYTFICSAGNITLKNSTLTDSGHGIPVQGTNTCTNFSMTNNLIQGSNNAGSLVAVSGTNPTMKWNWFKNAAMDMVDLTGTGTTNIRFNLFENDGSTGNWIFSKTSATASTLLVDFNTAYQSTGANNNTGYGFIQGTITGANEAGYNTIISTSGVGLAYAFCIAPAIIGATSTFNTHDNYLDLIGITDFTCAGSQSTGLALTNGATNLTSETGQTLVSP